jgi:hypothetical protein
MKDRMNEMREFIVNMNEADELIIIFCLYLCLWVCLYVLENKRNISNYEEEKDVNEKVKENENKKEVEVYEEKYLKKVRNIKGDKNKEFNERDLSLSFVMEKTPLGNVLMFYNKQKECFDYYSDSSMPYRYLEVVSRKYVLMNDCVSLYVDMEDELRLYEEKEKKKEEEKKDRDNGKLVPVKNVFAKFKSYNKEGGSGHVNVAPAPKNNILQKNVKNVNLILKEQANRYSYQGKMANFNFLKKVDRTKVDKKYAITYADFKRLKNMEGIYEKEKIFEKEKE